MLALALGACGDGGSGSGDQGVTGGTGGAANAPQGDDVLACADFLSTAQASAIGIDDWDEAAVESDPILGISCARGTLSVSVFRGDRFDALVRSIDRGGYPREEGPSFGSQTQWWSGSGLQAVYILSPNMRYVGSLLAPDRPALEQLAADILPYLDGR
jgi:hypothetical protein